MYPLIWQGHKCIPRLLPELQPPAVKSLLFHCVMSRFDVSLNSQVKFEVLGFGACSGCPS